MPLPDLPELGTRVAVRYRLPAGSSPPLTDVIGHLLAVDPIVRVQTKSHAMVDISPCDVVSVRPLTTTPLRTSQIRATEHAAALAWPGIEQQWIDGWLLRAADGHTHRANSAVPLEVGAGLGVLRAIVDWYTSRGLTPWLAVADRLLRLPAVPSPHLETVVMVCDLSTAAPDPTVSLAPQPDAEWLRLYQRDVPEEVLTAVVDGEVAFGVVNEAAVGRAAVTPAPDGTRWVGLSAVRVADDRRRQGHARALCSTLLAWGFQNGATRAYAQVLVDNTAALALYESLGFTVQHRARYVDARSV